MWTELLFSLGITSGVASEATDREVHQEKMLVTRASHLAGVRWEDRYESPTGTFSYGLDREGSLVIIGWMSDERRNWSVEDFTRWYLDERFAQVQNSKDLQRWEVRRAALIARFIDTKKAQLNIEFVSGSQFLSGPEVLGQARVSEQPFVLRFRKLR